MTTKLSERLRELQRQLDLCRKFHGAPSGDDMLLAGQCIAQAEAQEAQAKDTSDAEIIAHVHPEREAQAGELSDEEKQQLIHDFGCEEADAAQKPTSAQGQAIYAGATQAAESMLDFLVRRGYLRPSQAIGEHTPVDEEELIRQMKNAPVVLVPAMSSEARDKAIEAGNAMRVQLLALALDYRDAMLAKGGTELDLHPAHYDALDAWDQALSALRGESPGA